MKQLLTTTLLLAVVGLVGCGKPAPKAEPPKATESAPPAADPATPPADPAKAP